MNIITTLSSTNITISFDTSNKEVIDLVNLLTSTIKENTTNERILGTLDAQVNIINSKLGKDETVTAEVNLVELITPKLPLIIKVIKFVTVYEAKIKEALKPFKDLWSIFKTKEEKIIELKDKLVELEALAKNTHLDSGSSDLKHKINRVLLDTIAHHKNTIAELSS